MSFIDSKNGNVLVSAAGYYLIVSSNVSTVAPDSAALVMNVAQAEMGIDGVLLTATMEAQIPKATITRDV